MIAIRAAFDVLKEWNKDSIAEAIEQVSERFGISMGKLGQPIRVAITGGPVSPPIDVTVWLVGRKRTLCRLDRAIELINERAASSSGQVA